MEFVFSFKLHITPDKLEQMFFYDILLLYKRYEQHVEQENEQQKQQEAEYEDKMPEMPDYKNFSTNVQKQMDSFNPNNFNMDSITNNFSMPNF